MDPPQKQCNRQSSWSDDSILQDFGELKDDSFPLGEELGFANAIEPVYNSDRESLCGFSEMTEPHPPKRTRVRRARQSAKALTIRSKPRPKAEIPPQPESAEMLESLVEDMFAFPEPMSPRDTATPSEADSAASTARTSRGPTSEAESPQPYEQVFSTLCESSEGLQSIVSCLQNGNVDVCSVSEKKKIVCGLKERLVEIEGSVEALKESLKKLIKYTL